MIDTRFVPVTAWPGPKTSNYQRRTSPFRAAYSETLDLLESELKQVRARGILIQAYFRRQDIRNDGWPRSSARVPAEPGVILTFQKGDAVMSFPCDRFRSWEDNLRAIALSLQALRMVDRYGVTRNNEQYRGFTALPPADPAQARNRAIAFFCRLTGLSESEVRGDVQGAYRLAARAVHPDTGGGSHDQFVELQRHWQAIQ